MLGVAVISLPDSDDRLFSFSRTHGPSSVDLLGILVLLAAWLPVPAVLWRRRRALRSRTGAAAGSLAVAGAVGLAAAVGLDLGPAYLVPAMVLLLAQLLALGAVARWPSGRQGPD